MRKGTVEYEKNRKKASQHGGRSPSPITPEKRELQMDDIENDVNNAISLFDRNYAFATSDQKEFIFLYKVSLTLVAHLIV